MRYCGLKAVLWSMSGVDGVCLDFRFTPVIFQLLAFSRSQPSGNSRPVVLLGF